MLDWTDEQYDQYLRVRNMLDNAMPFFSGNEFKLLVFLVSRSLGEGRESITIALPEIVAGDMKNHYGTGLSRASVIRSLAVLEAQGLIHRKPSRARGGSTFAVNVKAIENFTA